MKKLSTILALCLLSAAILPAQTRKGFEVSGDNWHLWQDKDAAWKAEEPVFTYQEALPLPQAAPTKGWDVLTSSEALKVTVHGTAEQCIMEVPGPEIDLPGHMLAALAAYDWLGCNGAHSLRHLPAHRESLQSRPRGRDSRRHAAPHHRSSGQHVDGVHRQSETA